ncbi:trehalose-6-phosphate synthase [halophilic archaeon]|nr:trehalose-6-phosphate synthase [halophilic archaeon]
MARSQTASAREASTDDTELLVVSNRQPYSHEYGEAQGTGERIIEVDRPAGGLTAGLDPVMQQTDGTWIAWGDGDADTDVVDDDDCVTVPPGDDGYTLRRVWLSQEDVDNYYYGYSNQVLWPLCHGDPGRMNAEEQFWQRYQDVNRTFADAVAEQANDDMLVWFQDYHFGLAPRAVRNDHPDARLAQFWHIPWPAWDTFHACPHGAALLDGLLANDMLGFHVERYCRNFLRCVDQCLDDATVDWNTNQVRYRDDETVVKSFPMGVDFDRIECCSATDAADAFWNEFHERHGLGDMQIVLGVDRLDYTKGIPQRIAALERLWETRPAWRGELTYVQKGIGSREQIDEYQQLQSRVDDAIERVNGRFGTDDWQPIINVEEMLPTNQLYGLYRHSDIALVSPVRDGMNLVAKEYVAAQIDADGVLLLSELAGAHNELGEHALSINPYDTAGFADTIEQALTMDDSERERRMTRLRHDVASNNLYWWMNEFLNAARTHGITDEQIVSSTD